MNLQELIKKYHNIRYNTDLLENFDNIKNNWLKLPINEVVNSILNFIDSLKYIGV